MGTGQALRRAGVDTAWAFSEVSSSDDCAAPFPRVIAERNIVEAFPNAFLGVCLATSVYTASPGRGEKTDWLYEQCVARGIFRGLADRLAWDRPRFWQTVTENRHHDERAALVCAVTALCVLRGEYVAVGDATGGYFFMPPWAMWADWARASLDANRRDSRLGAQVEVWIGGALFDSRQALPPAAG
ncbi:MAG: hypothetical protein ACRD96_24880 [Bryobacteraceae bacterium]